MQWALLINGTQLAQLQPRFTRLAVTDDGQSAAEGLHVDAQPMHAANLLGHAFAWLGDSDASSKTLQVTDAMQQPVDLELQVCFARSTCT